MKKILLLALVVALATSTAAMADVYFYYGSTTGDEFNQSSVTTFGGAVGFTAFKYFGAEVVVDYINNANDPTRGLSDYIDDYAADLSDYGITLSNNTEIDTRMLFLSANIVLQLPLDGLPVTPYVTGGYGIFGVEIKAEGSLDVSIGNYLNYSEPIDESAEGGDYAWNFGFGVKVHVLKIVALRAEYRTYMLRWEDMDDEDIQLLLGDVDTPSFSRFAIGGAITF